MALFFGGLILGYFVARFSEAITGAFKRTETKIEREINSLNK